MLRGLLHIAVVISFLWLPLNRRHNIVLVYPIEDVGLSSEEDLEAPPSARRRRRRRRRKGEEQSVSERLQFTQ